MGKSRIGEFREQLMAAYAVGRLVPFIGAGLSRPTCPDWQGMVENLERQAGLPLPRGRNDADALIRRAHEAVDRLRNAKPGRFSEELRRALSTGDKQPSPQTVALARAWWPLVITTNYDNCFASEFSRHGRYLQVLGRHPMDCEIVLGSLTSASHALIWALQGFLDVPCRSPFVDPSEFVHLQEELVVGHAEYRRVTHREPHFRRAFAEVYRSRSMLFLGFGLRDRYILDLLGEILEIFGPSSHPHYAMLKKGEFSRQQIDFMRERYQIIIYEYPRHEDQPGLLDGIVDALQRASCEKTRWGYKLAASSSSHPDLEVVRGHLPTSKLPEKECLAVNAHRGLRRYEFSKSIRRLLKEHGVRPSEHPIRKSRAVGRFARPELYAAAPSSGRAPPDLRTIYATSLELFDRVWEDGYRHLHLQLLGAGSRRTYPVRMSFIQMVRAFASWRRSNRRRRLRLTLYAPDPPVADQLASGRLDVVELLSCTSIRFWVVVDGDDGRWDRRLMQRSPETPLATIRDDVRVPRRGWTMEIFPRPISSRSRSSKRPRPLVPTLESEGVVSGGTVVFVRA